MAIALAPLTPIATAAARYGAVALITYAVVRCAPQKPKDPVVESKLDAVSEGLELTRDENQVNLAGRFRRLIRLGKRGPGVKVDASGLARVRLSWVTFK